jgi:hypothetical protein
MADRRAAAAASRRAVVAGLSDDAVYDALFVAAQGEPGAPPSTFEPPRPDSPAPGHEQFTGQHIHQHSDYQGGVHVHLHTHAGDASHDHDRGSQ